MQASPFVEFYDACVGSDMRIELKDFIAAKYGARIDVRLLKSEQGYYLFKEFLQSIEGFDLIRHASRVRSTPTAAGIAHRERVKAEAFNRRHQATDLARPAGKTGQTQQPFRCHFGTDDDREPTHAPGSSPIEVLDYYVRGDLLGEGGFGQVFKAHHIGTGQTVAIKVINKTKCGREASLVEQEILFNKVLDHPNIVKMVEMVETSRFVFVVMEYVKAAILFDDDKICVDEQIAWYAFHQLVSAVSHCHKVSDVYSINIMMDVNGVVKLCDFGLSAFIGSGPFQVSVGTPGFMAPEMLGASAFHDGAKADIYSLGVTLHLLLTGVLPEYHADGSVAFLGPPNSQPGLTDLLSRMLAKDPAMRPTIKQVALHEWTTIGGRFKPRGSKSLPSINPEAKHGPKYVAELFRWMATFGWSTSDVRNGFASGKPTPQRLLFSLLSQARDKRIAFSLEVDRKNANAQNDHDDGDDGQEEEDVDDSQDESDEESDDDDDDDEMSEASTVSTTGTSAIAATASDDGQVAAVDKDDDCEDSEHSDTDEDDDAMSEASTVNTTASEVFQSVSLQCEAITATTSSFVASGIATVPALDAIAPVLSELSGSAATAPFGFVDSLEQPVHDDLHGRTSTGANTVPSDVSLHAGSIQSSLSAVPDQLAANGTRRTSSCASAEDASSVEHQPQHEEAELTWPEATLVATDAAAASCVDECEQRPAKPRG
ncbi:kinase-like domain-containing protein [Entophlyctis helioformis]|nr:kinase-like domain-containing protein [Entophlyctis helioformis]